jgi:hypothetical protein
MSRDNAIDKGGMRHERGYVQPQINNERIISSSRYILPVNRVLYLDFQAALVNVWGSVEYQASLIEAPAAAPDAYGVDFDRPSDTAGVRGGK